MQIHITRGEDSSGPYTLEQVRDYLAEGILLPDDLAYHEGLAGWTPLAEVLSTMSAPAPIAIPAVPELVPEQPPEAVIPQSVAEAPKSSKKKLIIAGAVLALFVLSGVGAIVYLKVFKKEDTRAEIDHRTPKAKPGSTNTGKALPPNPNTLIPGLSGGQPEPITPEPPTDADSARILEQAIRKTLEKTKGEVLTPDDLAKVKTFNVFIGANGTKLKDLAYLKRCPNLEQIFLQNHEVKSLAPLADLTKLSYLNLDGNQVADLAPLAKLPALKQVWLQGNQIKNLAPLAGLKTIEELRLDRNQIADLSPLGGLTALRELSLNENQVADLKTLAGLALLEELAIIGNPAKDFLPLAGLTKLKTLKFSPPEGTGLESVLGPMKALEQVYISGTVMKNLRPLVDALKDKPALVSIYAPQCQVEDISALADLPRLERLNFMGNRITNLKALNAMARLNSLILSNNRVTDLSPLTGAPNLSTLWLSGNQVQDVTPLKKLKKLRTVLLQSSRVTPAQLEELRQAIPGCRVNNQTAKPKP